MFGIYLILFLILTLPILLRGINHAGNNRKMYCILVFGAMFLFAALRGSSVGIDNANRYSNYTEMCRLDFAKAFRFMLEKNKYQYGYAFTTVILSRIIPSAHFIMLIFDGFVLFTVGLFFYRHAEDITIASLMYFSFAFSASLNITRQYLACAFFIWAIEMILRNKRIESILFLAAAALLHTASVILFASIYFIFSDFRLTRKKLLFVSTVAVLAFIFFDEISQFVVKRFLPQYSWYLRGSWAVGDVEFSILWLIIYIVIGVGLLLCIKPNHQGIAAENYIYQPNGSIVREKMFFISSIFYVIYALLSMLTSKVWIISRLEAFFEIGYYFTVGNVIKRIPNVSNGTKRIIRSVFIAGMSVWAILMFKQDGHGLFPYVFFWE